MSTREIAVQYLESDFRDEVRPLDEALASEEPPLDPVQMQTTPIKADSQDVAGAPGGYRGTTTVIHMHCCNSTTCRNQFETCRDQYMSGRLAMCACFRSPLSW